MLDKQHLETDKNGPLRDVEPSGVYSCLYVSQSNLNPPENRIELDNLLSFAHLRNKKLDVTGALLCASGRFAQILEGPELAVKLLMEKISADPRHRDIKIISEGMIATRRFSRWTLAYLGSSIYIDRHIKPLLQDLLTRDQADQSIARLIDLMVRQTYLSRVDRADSATGS